MIVFGDYFLVIVSLLFVGISSVGDFRWLRVKSHELETWDCSQAMGFAWHWYSVELFW